MIKIALVLVLLGLTACATPPDMSRSEALALTHVAQQQQIGEKTK